jgi:hypothetical protein
MEPLPEHNWHKGNTELNVMQPQQGGNPLESVKGSGVAVPNMLFFEKHGELLSIDWVGEAGEGEQVWG